MIQRLISAGLIGSAMLFGTANAAEPTYRAPNKPAYHFVKIDYPEAKWTQVLGIGLSGEFAGIYGDVAGVTHGFVIRRGEFASIDYPGAAYTDVRSINPAGDILGNYALPGENKTLPTNPGGTPVNIHGFVLQHDGPLISLAYPGHANMIAQRILPDGSVVGCLHDSDVVGSMRGFVWSQQTWSALDGSLNGIDVPASMNNGAAARDGSPTGVIVGHYTDLATKKTHAYVIQGGTFTTFDYPGAAMTQAWDVSPRGVIVGDYNDVRGGQHGFLLENGTFTPIGFPGAMATRVRGVNAVGVIVGWYRDEEGVHGYLAVRLGAPLR